MTEIFNTAMTAAHAAKKVIDYAIEVHNAPKDMKKIAEEIDTATAALSELRDLYRDMSTQEENVSSTSHGKTSSVAVDTIFHSS